jgi:hypothetical protein
MKLKLIEEVDKSQLIEPTVEWLKAKYDEMNKSLFDSKLQECEFEIFTKGRGMEGGLLGQFKRENPNIRYDKNGRNFVIINGEKEYINYDNFVKICKPKILINGNYRWTEKALLSTLVHEMCHYYTRRNGWRPKQSHGVEFKNIAYIVSSRSNGIFTVERIASAEQMSEMELNSAILAKKDKRKSNKLSKVIPTVIYKKNGEVCLVNALGMDVVKMVVDTERSKTHKSVSEIKICEDIELKELIFNAGYESSMKTYRYWNITSERDLLDKFRNYKFKKVYP